MVMIRHIRVFFEFVFSLLLIISILTGCGNDKKSTSEHDAGQKKSRSDFSIVSGSENKGLEPLIQDFAQKHGVMITIKYMGSVDMTLALSEQGTKIANDAVWPANSLWIALADRHKVVKHAESIMRSPVVLGVKKAIAQSLGWIDTLVSISDILSATKAGKLRFAMTSATQSNSGASAYLGFIHAFSGSPDILQLSDLQNPEVQRKVRALLSKVDRSSGSSGWLKETFVKHPERFQAMFNYESMIIEANHELTEKGHEPLYIIYPTDGIMISDSPLGYIDKGDTHKEELFKKLQAYLLSDRVQAEILSQGRRTGIAGMTPEKIDIKIFNPQWGIDITRIISPVPTPREEVIRQALELYQVGLRKPSCTAYVIDVSGSMEGKGLDDLKTAMTTLLDPDKAKRHFLQASPEDVHIIIPFDSTPRHVIQRKGNSREILSELLSFVQGLMAGGGTDIYKATAKGLEMLSRVENVDKCFPAVILMTDGRSQGYINNLQSAMNQIPMGYDIPIHSITFGNADETQLKDISELTIGRVFHGHDLVKAFRKAKGYN
jgi:Ca-activated chloride channel family protein